MKPRWTRTPAVVLGLSPTGLHVVRSLGKIGVPVIGIAERGQPGRYSRFLKRCYTANLPAERLNLLLRLFPTSDNDGLAKPVLIPTSDQDIELIIENATLLRQVYTFQASYEDGSAAQLLSKDRFYKLCELHRVSYPKIWATDLDGLAALSESIAFPCLIKPAEIHQLKGDMRGQKLWVAKSVGDFLNIVRVIPRNARTLLVQEIVPGAEDAITLSCVYVATDGSMKQMFTGRKLRQFPPGFGSASLVQSAPEPETEQISRNFLREIGYRGIAALEFKRHSVTGELMIIEVNARPSLWFSITEPANRPVVAASYLEMSGERDMATEGEQLYGIRWRYLSKDLASALFYRRNPNFVLPAPNIDVLGDTDHRIGPIFDPGDLAPIVGELLNYGRKAWRRAYQRKRAADTDEDR